MDGTMNLGGASLFGAGNGDIALGKLDAAGNHVFSLRAGDVNVQYAWDVTADPSGYAIAAGRFEGTIDFGSGPLTAAPGGYDAFVVKLQP
jgi:hypothetical protein